MSNPIVYVGVDVGCRELWAAMAGCRPRRFVHSAGGVASMSRWAGKIAGDVTVHICMEATGVYSRHVAVLLGKVVVSIVNPAQIKAFGRAQLRRTKTDAVDAQVILSYAQSQHPVPWNPEPVALQKLHELVTHLDYLQKVRGLGRNRQHVLSYWSRSDRSVGQSQRRVQQMLDKEIARIHQRIDELCMADQTLNKQVMLLCTIPGVANTTAVHLLAYGKCALTSRSGKELTAQAELAPAHRQSGTSVRGRSRIAKQGDCRLRRTLYMPTLVATRCNETIKNRYLHLQKQGKTKKQALVACMRKLLLISRAILISEIPFNPDYS
jgi:transposase